MGRFATTSRFGGHRSAASRSASRRRRAPRRSAVGREARYLRPPTHLACLCDGAAFVLALAYSLLD